MPRIAATTSATATLALLVLLAASGGSAASTTTLEMRTAGRIEALTMSGSRVAYDVAASSVKRRCNAVSLWDLRSRHTQRVSGPKTCNADGTSTGVGVRELALAGPRVAWIVSQGGNSERDDYLYTAISSGRGERRLALAVRSTDNGEGGGPFAGDWIGGLVGARTFLAVGHWTTDATGAVTTARLQLVGATRLRTIASSGETLEPQSTDGALIAALRANGEVALYSPTGRLERTVTPAGAAVAAALRGDYLVVLTKDARLEVRNAHSGRLLHTWRVARGATDLDVSSGLASYAASLSCCSRPHSVHVVRLATGKDTLVARFRQGEVHGVELEPAGLVYAVNRGDRPGRLVFVPMSRLRGLP